ncbi:biotin--[acetyl-CoA-carboxylase] ligase [Faecalicoccus pleomorphus]|uniref:biotin--[acetyl-CoA-carboxylase] ligase n=1 Tax=Faecalicoccus pleomorphus TaxID=1323 RepID=UPI0026EAA089|nr:biotin--[acetyl-CoA-carboxylase] ligase [Faecalicoccus pleomorphus]
MLYYVDPLNKENIEQNCPSFYDIHIFDILDSTNTWLQEHSGLPEGTVILADEQTQGRGRNGRCFHSPKGSGIYCSLLLKPRENLLDVLECTAMAAVACIKAIEEQYNLTCSIKWLNDILLDQKKLAGILCEGKLYQNHMEYLIIGIGINVHSFIRPKELESIAASIEDYTAIKKPRNELIAKFLTAFYSYYSKSDDFRSLYRQRLAFVQRTIQVITPQENYSAILLGVDDRCRLKIQKADGSIDYLSSGEISIRL